MKNAIPRAWRVMILALALAGTALPHSSLMAVTNTYYVDLAAPASAAPYSSWNTAATSILDGVSQALAGYGGGVDCLVLVTNGIYALTNTIYITKSITVRSVGGPTVTIVDANASSSMPQRVFVFSNACSGAVLDGFTIKGGCTLGRPRNHPDNPPPTNCPSGDPGAGICMLGGTVINCHVAFNTTYWYAAGIWMNAGLVENCLIYSNEVPSTAHDGCCNWPNAVGGVYIGGANATVQNCEIFGNIGRGAGWGPAGGAGVGLMSGKLLNSSVHHNNLYGGFGGSGINMDPGSGGLVSNCLVYGNGGAPGAGRGTGIWAGSGKIVDTIITNNSGGSWPVDTANAVTLQNVLIANHPGQISIRPWGGGTMDNCTMAGNGYGVDRQNGPTFVMRNCINTNPSGAFYTGAGANLTIVMSNCLSTTLSGAGITSVDSINTDPMFVDATGANFRLQKKSPCVDSGIITEWMTAARDLDGVKRVRGPCVDMGCYEAAANPGTLILLR